MCYQWLGCPRCRRCRRSLLTLRRCSLPPQTAFCEVPLPGPLLQRPALIDVAVPLLMMMTTRLMLLFLQSDCPTCCCCCCYSRGRCSWTKKEDRRAAQRCRMKLKGLRYANWWLDSRNQRAEGAQEEEEKAKKQTGSQNQRSLPPLRLPLAIVWPRQVPLVPRWRGGTVRRGRAERHSPSGAAAMDVAAGDSRRRAPPRPRRPRLHILLPRARLPDPAAEP